MIKSESKAIKQNNKRWLCPCLGVYCPDKSNLLKEKFTVLFNSQGGGTVVHVDFSQYMKVGDYYPEWIMDNFVPIRKGGNVNLIQE